MTDTDTIIHPTAVVAQNATVGRGTKVWHWTHIMQGAQIGDGCVLGQNVFIGRNVKIGNRCKIQNNVSVYAGVTLEDGVFVGPSAVFTNVLTPRAEVDRHDKFTKTMVQEGATIGANATVVCGSNLGHHCFIASGCVVPAQFVPAYALMMGVPAKQRGWSCICGVTLVHNRKVRFLCPDCHRLYVVDASGQLQELVR